MKKIVVLSMLVLFAYAVCGQSMSEKEEDSRKIYFGGTLHYGLIEDNQLYLSMPDSMGPCYLWSKQLETRKTPVIYDVGWTWSNGVWNKGDNMISCLSLPFNSIYAVRQWDVEQKNLISCDTINIGNPDWFYYDMLIYPFVDYRRSFVKAYVKQEGYFASERSLREKVDQVINMDIYSQNSASLHFYIRDRKTFYAYTIAIDTITNRFDPEKDIGWRIQHERACWQEDVVYAAPDFNPDYPPHKYSKSYSGQKTQLNAITDSLFFEGNYKVIMQDGCTYLFNRKHGHIYLLTDTKVIRIGTIRITDDYPAIKGYKYIIEDRDRGVILLFAPVDWHDNISPKPIIEVLSAQTFYQQYKLEEPE